MVQLEDTPNVEFISRVSRLPLVDFALGCASLVYGKAKDGSPLIIQKTLSTAELTVKFAVDRALPVVNRLEKPIQLVDVLACKTLDQIEAKLPIVTKSPEEIVTSTRVFVAEKGGKVQGAVVGATDMILGNPVGQLALKTANCAIDVVDGYMDRYLPSKTSNDEKEEIVDASLPPSQQLAKSVRRAVGVATKVPSRVAELSQPFLHDIAVLGLAYVGSLATLVEWLQAHWKDAQVTGLPAKLRQLASDFSQQFSKLPPNHTLFLVVDLTERVAGVLRNALETAQRVPRKAAVEVRNKLEHGLNLITDSSIQFAKSTNLDEVALQSLARLQERLPVVYSAFLDASKLTVDVSKKVFPNWNVNVDDIALEVNRRSYPNPTSELLIVEETPNEEERIENETPHGTERNENETSHETEKNENEASA